jgi:CheY-like chemotaxis protein
LAPILLGNSSVEFAQANGSRMNSLVIVVADDEPEIRALVSDVLEEAGYAVRAFGDGLNALTDICAAPPALALLDVAMPVMSGDEALRNLRAAGVTIPVIMMTAGTSPQRFLNDGATAVLAKPFEISRLLMMVAQTLLPAQRLREVALGDRPSGGFLYSLP